MAASVDLLVPELRGPCRDLIAAASYSGLQPRLTSTLRSTAEQTRLYRRFLGGQQGFPVAPPGSSAHEYGWAFDLVVSPMSALADVGYTWQTWGGAWNPGDAVHFELPGASEEAKRLGGGETRPLRDWILQLYGEIPWWVSLLLPMATTTQSADVPYTAAQAAKILKQAGLS